MLVCELGMHFIYRKILSDRECIKDARMHTIYIWRSFTIGAGVIEQISRYIRDGKMMTQTLDGVLVADDRSLTRVLGAVACCICW